MKAHTPHELPLIFEHHLNAQDVAGLMADYYAEDATYAPVPGQVVSGSQVAPAIGNLVALGKRIEVTVRHVLRAGDTALIVLDWELPEAGMAGTATDVARRQSDGTWRCIIDNPHGAESSVERRAEVADRLRSARLGVCLLFLCEAGYSARNAREHQETLDMLLALPFYGIDAEVEARALGAQRQLARAGHHRLPFPDLLIAAIADRHRCAVLHYDTDYDLLRERTDLRFDSEWLAERGSL